MHFQQQSIDNRFLRLQQHLRTEMRVKSSKKTNVVVNTTRKWYGKNSTVSTFIATAYNEQGDKIDSMNGYF